MRVQEFNGRLKARVVLFKIAQVPNRRLGYANRTGSAGV